MNDGPPRGQVDISDLIFLVDYYFRGGPLPPVMERADLDHNGVVDIADIVELVRIMFE